MTPSEWDNNDPGDLPVRWRENDENSACDRCGQDVGLPGAELCEACHGRVTLTQYKR